MCYYISTMADIDGDGSSYEEMGYEHGAVTLLLVGLDNAGKTTAAKGIIGEPVDDVAPTVGFAPESLQYRGCEVTIYDLGGGHKIRPVWTKYFSEVHGVIFVVDSSDSSRLEECKEVLTKLLSAKKIAGKPVLVLANKQDVEGAMDEVDVVEGLGIEQVVNKYKCPTRVETCSANTTRPSNKPDKPIADGFRWLIDTIVVHYKEINARVEKDLLKERNKQKKEMDERRERIRRIRLEREKAEERRREAEMKRRQDGGIVSSDDDGEEIIEGEEEAIVENIPSSSIPNGTLPQFRERGPPGIHEERREKRANISASENLRLARLSPEEKQELKELGFNSHTELNESSSSASLQSTEESEPVSPSEASRAGKMNRAGEMSRAGEASRAGGASRAGEMSRTGKMSGNEASGAGEATHKVILVQESPSHQHKSQSVSPAHNATTTPLPPHNATTTPLPPILHANGYATSNGITTPRLDLCRDGRKDECIPIDSDDELFDLTSSLSGSWKKDTPSPFSNTASPFSNNDSPLSNTYVKDQLELETGVSKSSKKKSFLKRYHKTAPLQTA